MKNWREAIHMKKSRDIWLFTGLALGVLLLILTMVKSDLEAVIPDHSTQVGNRDELQIVKNFVSGTTIQQEFTCGYDFDYECGTWSRGTSIFTGDKK